MQPGFNATLRLTVGSKDVTFDFDREATARALLRTAAGRFPGLAGLTWDEDGSQSLGPSLLGEISRSMGCDAASDMSVHRRHRPLQIAGRHQKPDPRIASLAPW